MGGDDAIKKPFNTFSLLQMKMSEIEKSKKPSEQSSSKSLQNSGTSSKANYSSKTTLSKTLKKSPVKEKEPMSGKKKITDPNIPDRSYGDYFCSTCDSHMNSDAMWEAHITGKRHLKNIKKGDPDPKYEDLEIESSVKYEIRNVKDPVVGLSYIHEIRRKEAGAPPLFTCFLCQATFATVPMVVEHVICMKHRLNYMKENSPDDYQLLCSTNLKKGHMEPLVVEIAVKLENKFGRGSVKVKQERIRQTSYSATKRAYDSDDDDDDDDDDDRSRKMPKRYEEKKNPFVWKAVDCKKRDNFKDSVKSSREMIKDRKRQEAYSSDEEIDTFKRHDYTRQTPYDGRSSKYESTPPRDSSKRDYYPRTSPPVEHYPHSRSFQRQEKTSRAAEDYPLPTESKTGNSDSNVLKDFVQKVYALPTEIFLKIVLLKLENMDLKGIEELSLLSKLITKAQAVLCSKLPPGVQALVKEKMSQNTDGNVQKNSATPRVMPQVAESSSFNAAINFKPPSPQPQRTGFSFLKDYLDQSKNTDSSSSVSQNRVPNQAPQQSNMSFHQSSSYGPSYQNGSTMSSNVNYSSANINFPSSSVNYPYNSPPASTTSSIPGLTLTEENRDTQSSYGSYQPHQPHQPHYPDPSSSFPPYRY